MMKRYEILKSYRYRYFRTQIPRYRYQLCMYLYQIGIDFGIGIDMKSINTLQVWFTGCLKSYVNSPSENLKWYRAERNGITV
jgi:hypothetical protein